MTCDSAEKPRVEIAGQKLGCWLGAGRAISLWVDRFDDLKFSQFENQKGFSAESHVRRDPANRLPWQIMKLRETALELQEDNLALREEVKKLLARAQLET